MKKKPLINNQIKVAKIRLINEKDEQLGIVSLGEGLKLAQEQNLDLIQVTEKVDPPVCRIMDYGKYLYREKRKEKTTNKTHNELKGIRLSFKISNHDMEVRAKLAEKFLKKGNRVKIELVLRGREKALADFGREKLNTFLEILQQKIAIKTEKELKREARGFTMILTKA